ncbi:MAG: hypothetical protein KME26_22200 [Oscillatoria princeps RMCB-10]|jgi:hypothetical protein|nr:hypothetical protein [Oscillatoria princeps RMCB-10]
MGDAKRRKALDPKYGQQKSTRLWIGTAPITGKHMVFLRVGSNEMGISPHYKLKDAEYALSRCQQCLDSLPAGHWNKPWAVAKSEFIFKLNAEFEYPDDDEVLGVIRGNDICTDPNTLTESTREINDKAPLFTAIPSWHPDAPTID